jgi:hypothetical protein
MNVSLQWSRPFTLASAQANSHQLGLRSFQPRTVSAFAENTDFATGSMYTQ